MRLLLTLPFIAILLHGSAAQAEVKIGYVDLQRAIAETKEGKSAKRKLKAIFTKKQNELDGKQRELKKMKEDFDKQKAILKPDAAQKRARELEQKFVELQQTYLRLQKDLSEREKKMTQPIFNKMSKVIAKIATSEGFTVILERSDGLLWAQPSLDLTSQVIRNYNSGAGTKKRK